MSTRTENATDSLRVVSLEIDVNGTIRQRLPRMDRENQLEKTLLQGLYPAIRVAAVNVPSQPLDAYEESQVAQALANIIVDGVCYRLIGASGSAKNGKFYAVDAAHDRLIADRFQQWPQAAITYFGILVSPCKVRIEEPDCRLLVVPDHVLGTNDCRGWISRSLFTRLRLPAHRFYQFRLAFEKTQAKGSFKVMEDAVAEALEADIILPESCVKPGLKSPINFFQKFLGQGKSFRGPVVLGVREISRELEFESSYTLIEHCSTEALEREIKPYAMELVRKLNAAVDEGDYGALLQILGASETQQPVDDPAGAHTSAESTVVEAVLKADASGALVKHPHINSQLQRLLAKWAFKVSTGGGLRLPAFALADDGFLVLHDGQIISGSDWMPEDRAITSLACRKGLCVRYPIRMFEDLLPFEKLSTEEAVELVGRQVQKHGLTAGEIVHIVEEQVSLEGTFTLNSKTAARNGGDFDFDLICVVDGNRLPLFVEHRFSYREQFNRQKEKNKKQKSPWFNLPAVAMQARGNQIGSITDLKTSCMALGQTELAYQLVDQLQASLDNLKHGTQVNQEVLAEIRKHVKPAPWLKLKNKRRVSEMPVHLEVAETDKIGQLYNLVRKEIGKFFEEVLPVGEFRGLITGERFTREVFDECRDVSRIFAANIALIMERQKTLEAAANRAEVDFEAQRHDPVTRKHALFRRNQAQAALHFNEERTREEVAALSRFVRKWAEGKRQNRMSWCQALHTVACGGKGNGSILFMAFPQEVVDKIVERTGGKPVQVYLPELCDGEIEFDGTGRVFLVEPFRNGDGQLHERRIFLFQLTDNGEVLIDGRRTRQVQPFPLQPGRGEIRDGRVVFAGIPQQPGIRQHCS